MFGVRKVDKLRLTNAKLLPDFGSAALKLIDCLFTEEEMVNGNPSGNTKSSDPIRKASIFPLDSHRMQYIYGKIFISCSSTKQAFIYPYTHNLIATHTSCRHPGV